ncbi:MAG: FKBP-type peptidyl-prolyl cis-trans isomerase [Thermoguttaceae bacterium]|jgi:FKBP-type peptidyl-prolyl cis-trans isomerase FklB
MRLAVLLTFGFCLSAAAGYAQQTLRREAAPEPLPQIDPKDAATISSYGIGRSTGHSLREEGIDIDFDAFVQGLRDGAAGATPKYTEPQFRAAMQIFQREMQAKQDQRRLTAADKNRSEGQAFLARNKAKPDVTTLASGLQYKVLRSGTGHSPKASDTVKVHYEGTLLDGTVFDSSIKRGEPAVFPVRGVIRGWTEALQLMKVGDKLRLFIPPELAYGSKGAGNVIGPNAVLTFDVELLAIEPPGAPEAAQ